VNLCRPPGVPGPWRPFRIERSPASALEAGLLLPTPPEARLPGQKPGFGRPGGSADGADRVAVDLFAGDGVHPPRRVRVDVQPVCRMFFWMYILLCGVPAAEPPAGRGVGPVVRRQ